MTNEKMREEFEKWATENRLSIERYPYNAKGWFKPGHYVGIVQDIWIGWQASRENLNELHNKKLIVTKDFNKYLESTGWYVNSTIPGIANIWRSNVYKNEEILQPINYDLLDFELRINDLIQVLSKTQQKIKNEIINEINNYIYCQQKLTEQGVKVK